MVQEENALDVTVILPCRDEAATVAESVAAALKFIREQGLNGEVLVVDNGSTDGSGALALTSGARVVREETPGYGAALRRGIRASCGRVILMLDADLTYDFSDLEKLYRPLAAGRFDMMIGDRFSGGIEPGAMPPSHHIGVRALSAFGRWRFHTDVRDFHCGLRGLTAESVKKLKLSATGMEFATEMIAEAALAGLKIGQTPVRLRRCPKKRKPKLRTIRDGFRHLFLILCVHTTGLA